MLFLFYFPNFGKRLPKNETNSQGLLTVRHFMGSLACATQGFPAMPREAGLALFTSETFRREASWVPPQKQKLDPVDQVSTLWITLPPSGPTKRVSREACAVRAIGVF